MSNEVISLDGPKTIRARKVSKISAFVIIGFTLLGILITAGSCLAGYLRYTSIMEKMYNDKAYEIAYSAMADLDADLLDQWYTELRAAKTDEEIAEVSAKIQAEPEYQKELEVLTNLRDNMNCNYVYIADQKDETGKVTSTFLYMMDAENPNDAFPPFIPGDKGNMNESFLSDSEYIYETGNRPDNYFYSHSAFGYNTSAIAAIKNSEGKVVAVLGVEIAMSNLAKARTQYILSTVFISLLITAIMVLIYTALVRRKLLEPIETIIKETNSFVENGAEASAQLSAVATNNELEDLAMSIYTMEKNIKEYIEDLTQVTKDKERISAELDIATHIQASMLPNIFPAFPERKEFDIYATMNPAKEVGGDFYDFFMVDDTHLAVVMADVSGKGVPAALFMVIGKTLIKDHSQSGIDLGTTFSNVNEMLCQANSEGLFITAFEGVLDLTTGDMNFVNAGHEMPFVYSPETGFKPYKIRAGFVLAGMEGMRYRGGSIHLNPGDKFFQYTDGVTEATNADNKLYGMERLERILNISATYPPNELLPNVKRDIDQFVGEAPQFDDITMLCVELKEYMKKEEA